jgi:hypothetical protein
MMIMTVEEEGRNKCMVRGRVALVNLLNWIEVDGMYEQCMNSV